MKYIIVFCLFLCSRSAYAANPENRITSLAGKLSFLPQGDTVTLLLDKYGEPGFRPFQQIYTAVVSNHGFAFSLPPADYPRQFYLQFRGANAIKNLSHYYLETADRISLADQAGMLVFSGKGADRCRISQRLAAIYDSCWQGLRWGWPADTRHYFEKMDLCAQRQLAYLHTRQNRLSQAVFDLLQADAFALVNNKGDFIRSMSAASQQKALENLQGYHSEIPRAGVQIPLWEQKDILQYADLYADALVQKYMFDSCTLVNKPLNVVRGYQYLMRRYTGKLRERIAVNLLYRNRNKARDLSACIDHALSFITNEDFREILKKLKSNRIKGAVAYNFKLPGTDGTMHQLTDFKGKVVVMDFWYTGCGNCVRLAPYLAAIETRFKARKVIFCSISTDVDKNQWISSVRDGKYTSELAVNVYTAGVGEKHPLLKYYDINGFPTLIVIDKLGHLLNNPVDPRTDGGESLVALLEEEEKK